MMHTKKIKRISDCKQHENNFTKPPNNFELPSDETFYWDCQAEYRYQQKELEFLRNKRNLRNEKFKERIQIVRKCQDEEKSKFLQLNNFLRTTDEQIKIGFSTIKENTKIQDQLKIDIEEKRKNFAKLSEFLKKLQITAEEYKIYEDLAEIAADQSEIFQSISDLTEYCDALLLVNEEITDTTKRLLGGIDKLKKRLMDGIKKAQFMALGLKTELSNLSREYEETKYKVLYWERRYNEAYNATISRQFDLNRTRDGIWSIYRLLCQRRCIVPQYERFQVEKELDWIKDEVQNMRDVVEEYQKRKSK